MRWRWSCPPCPGRSCAGSRRVTSRARRSRRRSTWSAGSARRASARRSTCWEEAARTREEVAATVAEYRAALHAGDLPSGISVKLTALSLAFDAGLCRAGFEELAREAAARGRFLRIDMEASPTIDATLGLYRELRAAGHDSVGIALQARLRRTLDDIGGLAELKPDVRLCKGIYVEPAAVAFQEHAAVRAAYVRALELLLAAGSRLALATHDEWLLGESLRLAGEAGLGPDGYDVQMLLGVREERASQLVADGRRVRIYVPYGVRWYEYSLRRLLENPAWRRTSLRPPSGARSAAAPASSDLSGRRATSWRSSAPAARRPRCRAPSLRARA